MKQRPKVTARELAKDAQQVFRVAKEELRDAEREIEQARDELIELEDELPGRQDMIKFAQMLKAREWEAAGSFYFYLDPDDQDFIRSQFPDVLARLRAAVPDVFDEEDDA